MEQHNELLDQGTEADEPVDSFGCEWHSNFVRAKSSRSKTMSETAVLLDLMRKGFDPHQPMDRDCIHDCVIEVAQDVWWKIQIKSCYNGTSVNLWTRGSGSTAPVSPGENTKPRNNTGYYNSGIHLIAVVTNEGVCYYDTRLFDANQKSFSIRQYESIPLQEMIDKI